MYCNKDIIIEGNPLLYQKCQDVKFPLSMDDEKCIRSLTEYMMASEVEELTEKYKIRPGVGIAAPQVGVIKRMFAINCTDFLDENKTKYFYAFINPKIIGKSEEMTYLPGGEGCLSVTRETEGLVTPRHYAIRIKAATYDYNTGRIKNVTMTLEGYPAIVFQHEYDHLDGILYTSKMFKPEELDKKIFPLYTIDDKETDEDNKEEK